MLKLGSLFDGSGGFPLAGALCGIEPVWASEIEPYPIAVTKTRFPHMKHLGDISKINGAEIEPVDIITFGSPCQDLSVAGKRAGLKHETNGDDETTRSGLFMEAVRIIKEMRKKTNGEYPRYAVWENVPGAFSSNKGEDFKVVLEELVKIAAPSASMPDVPKFGWPYADSYCGNGWSLAYRVLDAQYWGVPQRRRRIYLVADFGGQRAREILFEREGLRGYFTQGGTPWKAAPSDAEGSLGADDRTGEIPYTLKIRSGCEGGGKGALIQNNMSATLACNNDQYLFQPIGYDDAVSLEPGIAAREGGHVYENVSGTLRANAGDNQMAVAYGISSYESNAMKSKNPHSGIYEADTSRTLDLNGGNPACNQGGIAIVEPAYGVVTKGNGDAFIAEERHTALTAGGGQAGQGYPCAMQPLAIATQQGGAEITNNGICPTITAAAGMSGNNQPWICHPDSCEEMCIIDSIGGQAERAWIGDVAPCLKATHYKNPPCIVEAAGFCTEHSAKSRSIGYEKEIAPTLRAGVTPAVTYGLQRQLGGIEARENISPTILAAAGESGNNQPCVAYVFENHSQDTRYRGPLDVAQTVSSTYGMGGNNQPFVVTQEPFCKSRRAKNADDATTWKHGEVANTLNTFDQGEVRTNELVVETVALEGNGQRPSHRGDGYAVTDKSYTLNSTEVHGVAYAIDQQGGKGNANYEENIMPTMCSDSHGTPHAVAYEDPIAIDRAFFNQGKNALYEPQTYEDGTVPTLVAKGPGAVAVRYIVRRLTPTECARLQGFADRWGDIEPKSKLSDDEYHFWLDVRKTYDAINGRADKDYTKKQILTWYNKLQTDSAEYKMWGNGIALPTALYVIQGIAVATKGAKND